MASLLDQIQAMARWLHATPAGTPKTAPGSIHKSAKLQYNRGWIHQTWHCNMHTSTFANALLIAPWPRCRNSGRTVCMLRTKPAVHQVISACPHPIV